MIRKLIVNADDLGLSKKINDGILESHIKGIVTSSSLMVTMPAVEHALSNVQGTDLDVGLHIDLSWGKAIALPTDIPSLIDKSGKFIGKNRLLKKLALRKIHEEELLREISAQVMKFKETGLDLFHIDVHQHFHGFPAVMRSLSSIARRERIPYVRFVNEKSFFKPVNAFIYLMFVISKKYFEETICRTDNFLGLQLTDNLNEKTLASHLLKIKPGLTELMCHPGYDDPSLAMFSRLQSRQDEITALTSDKVKDIIAVSGITLTTFKKVLKSPGSIPKKK